jgi:hypothetical protein
MAEDIFDKAIGYPYSIPTCSYVYHNGSCEDVDEGGGFPDVSGLTPVLAVGSNQSPTQLARKFPGDQWAPIPVSKVAVVDFDTVFSAHITGYGSIAATLFHAPGTIVNLFVNWLDDHHLVRMHDTELGNENYEFGALENVRIEAEVGPSLNSVSLYHGLRGIFAPKGKPVPLAEVPARNRQYDELSQHQVQSLIRDQIAPEKPLENFVHESVNDQAVRKSRTELIGRGSLPFSFEGYVPKIS